MATRRFAGTAASAGHGGHSAAWGEPSYSVRTPGCCSAVPASSECFRSGHVAARRRTGHAPGGPCPRAGRNRPDGSFTQRSGSGWCPGWSRKAARETPSWPDRPSRRSPTLLAGEKPRPAQGGCPRVGQPPSPAAAASAWPRRRPVQAARAHRNGACFAGARTTAVAMQKPLPRNGSIFATGTGTLLLTKDRHLPDDIHASAVIKPVQQSWPVRQFPQAARHSADQRSGS